MTAGAGGGGDSELWTIEKVAEFLNLSQSRAYALLSDRGIRRVSGYPAHLVRRIQRRQGARTDLTDHEPSKSQTAADRNPNPT